MKQDFHEAEDARVLNPEARDWGGSGQDGQSETLEQGELDVDIQGLRLELGEPVGDVGQALAYGFQVIPRFFQLNSPGDAFTATVTEPFIVDGRDLIPADSTVQGRIARLKRPGQV